MKKYKCNNFPWKKMGYKIIKDSPHNLVIALQKRIDLKVPKRKLIFSSNVPNPFLHDFFF